MLYSTFVANRYRIIVELRYADAQRGLNGIVWVQFIGTHAEYDLINAEAIEFDGS